MLYRIYFLDEADRIRVPHDAECADDDAAAALAADLIGSYAAVEIWAEARFVERIDGAECRRRASMRAPQGGQNAAR